MKNEPFVIERAFNVPIEKVWEALTNSDKMKEWYFDIPGFKPEPGFEFQFEGGTDDKRYIHLCKVTEVIQGKKLVHTWKYEGYPGNSSVSFELFAEPGTTRLKLTHEGLDSFPADNPDFAKQNFIAGWTQIIGSSLKNYLEKA